MHIPVLVSVETHLLEIHNDTSYSHTHTHIHIEWALKHCFYCCLFIVFYKPDCLLVLWLGFSLLCVCNWLFCSDFESPLKRQHVFCTAGSSKWHCANSDCFHTGFFNAPVQYWAEVSSLLFSGWCELRTQCEWCASLWNKSFLHSLTTAQGLFITVHCGNHIHHTA